MKRTVRFLVCLLGIASVAQAHFMSKIWPEKSIARREFGDTHASHRVLIGGISSPFKDSIIAAVIDSLTADSVYVKTVGLKDLQNQKPGEWDAVLIANTCMAWEIEDAVRSFVGRYPGYRAFVVLTTSGDPKGCGSSKNLPANIDAVATASVKERRSPVLGQLLADIREKLKSSPQRKSAAVGRPK
jgi:hypothetical protein